MTSERLVGLHAALEGVVDAVEHLLVYLRTTERLLLAQAGRVGPTLLGGIESAAERLRDRDRLRHAATTRLTGDATSTGGPPLTAVAAADAPWAASLEERIQYLEDLVGEIDRTATSLKRLGRRPVAVTAGGRDAASARALLTDALEQGLDELVPPRLRAFLSGRTRPGRG